MASLDYTVVVGTAATEYVLYTRMENIVGQRQIHLVV